MLSTFTYSLKDYPDEEWRIVKEFPSLNGPSILLLSAATLEAEKSKHGRCPSCLFRDPTEDYLCAGARIPLGQEQPRTGLPDSSRKRFDKDQVVRALNQIERPNIANGESRTGGTFPCDTFEKKSSVFVWKSSLPIYTVQFSLFPEETE